jgi:hypothetical protein
MSFEQLQSVRSEIAEIKYSITQIENMALCEKDTLENIDESLTKLRSSFDIHHLGMTAANGFTIAPVDFLNAVIGEEKTPALLATFAGDRMREMLIDAAKPFIDKKAIPVTQRGEKILALQQRLLDLEKEDERLFIDLEERGYGPASGLTRRPDADMSAVLLIEDENDE